MTSIDSAPCTPQLAKQADTPSMVSKDTVEDSNPSTSTALVAVVQKIPTSIKAAQDYLKGDYSATAVATLGSAITNKVKALAVSRGRGAEFKSLQTPEDKHAWMAQFIAEGGGEVQKKGFNKHVAYDKTHSDHQDHWLLESQIASSDWLNSAEAAHILCQSGELADQPSQFKSLADKGYKEYKISRAFVQRLTGRSDSAGVKAEADIDDNEYEAIRDGIGRTLRDGPARKKPKLNKEKVQPTAEQLSLAEVLKTRSTSLSKLKQSADRVHKELQTSKSQIQTVLNKGYPAEMGMHISSVIDGIEEKKTATMKVYTDEIGRQDGKNNETLMREVVITIDAATVELEAMHNSVKKSTLQDLKKLAS